MCVADRSEAQTVTNNQQPKLEQKTFPWGYFTVFEPGWPKVKVQSANPENRSKFKVQSSMWVGQSSRSPRSMFNSIQFSSIQFAVQFNATLVAIQASQIYCKPKHPICTTLRGEKRHRPPARKFRSTLQTGFAELPLR